MLVHMCVTPELKEAKARPVISKSAWTIEPVLGPPGLPGKSLSQKKRKEDKCITLMPRVRARTHTVGVRERKARREGPD